MPLPQRFRALEIGARQLEGGAGVGHFGDTLDLEGRAVGDAEAGFDLRGVGLCLGGLRFGLGGGELDECRAGGHTLAALDRCRDDAAGDFGRDIGVVFRGQRAADADVAGDRPGLGGGGGDGDGRRLGWRVRTVSRGAVASD